MIYPWPVTGQVQDRSALGSGQPGRDIDDFAAQRRAAGYRVRTPGQDPSSAQQIVSDRRAQHPGGVGAEAPRGHVRQGAVDQIGEDGFDDRVAAMGDVSLVDRQVGVSEERVIPPHREQCVAVAGVFDPAHHQAAVIRSLVDAKAV
ncbi:hypothetical protein ACVWWN_000131 [Mycobacterium sp. URHB0021]